VNKKKKLFFKAILSLFFFSVLVSFIQGNELALIFSRIDWTYLLLSFALSPVMIGVSCLKWKMILDAGGSRIPFTTLFRIYLIGYFFSNMLPSTVGGDVVRSFYSGKLIQDQSYSAIAIFIERFSGIFFLFFLVIFTPLLLPSLYSSPYVIIPVAGSVVLIILTLWIARVKDPYVLPRKIFVLVLGLCDRMLSLVRYKKREALLEAMRVRYEKFMQRLETIHGKLVLALGAIRKDRKLLLQLVVLTALFYLLTWINVSVAFLALGVEHQFLHICALIPTILFVAHFPVTLLGNLGFFESVFVFYFLLVSIPATASLAMGMVLRMKMLLLGIIGFFVYMKYKQETGDDLKEIPEKS